ncbi:Uncharacterised protein [Salmonella enterica subsp. enterica serovar Sendai]|nr:Uncharacterised protein [Salmonella enterica subsp. enterica serovar Sendai]
MAERKKKTITGQVLNSIKINKLKCINGLNEIIFKPHALTAIFPSKIITRIPVLFMYIYIYFCDEFKPQCSHSPCGVMKHFRNGYRVCINCFSHVVANTFSGNFRYFIVIHFISYKII